MDKCREAFEKQKHLTIYISNLVFDEKDNRYIPNEKRIRTFEEWEWKAFSNQAYAVNLAWWAWQSRQAEVDELSQENTRLKYLVGEKIGHPSARDLLDAEVQRQLEEQKQSENKEFLTDEDIENLIKGVLKDHDENPNKYWINIYKQVDDLQIVINDKDKRIKELEKKLLNLASMYSTKAAEFNIKDEQKLATVCNEISQILEKALRGEHEA
ncbi:hypothetical protein I6M74_08250 [Acinetobacter bereziniae]|uniref:hypothetical protein n=1 Tax=Acinetobacter bereziniae TaxID=106648 RepID=UPI0018FF829C|nr:hypothetical protein [Acinetobacter bereziniae]MBJ8421890.1 hypothetical protein [Acinetobacter bereziniae]